MQSNRQNMTLRQRLDKAEYTGEIPEKYIDQYISYDIMDNPVKVNGKYIMDYKNLLIHFGNKINAWRQNTQDGLHYYNVNETPILETIAGGHERLHTIEFLDDLRTDIESWVWLKEIEKENQKKAAVLHKLEEEIDTIIQKIHSIIEADNNKSSTSLITALYRYLFNSYPDEKQELEAMLFRLDVLNKTKDKLNLGDTYYKGNTLLYEINRLLQKQEKGELLEEEKHELELCYKRLDKGNALNVAKRHSILSFFRAPLAPQENTDLSSSNDKIVSYGEL